MNFSHAVEFYKNFPSSVAKLRLAENSNSSKCAEMKIQNFGSPCTVQEETFEPNVTLLEQIDCFTWSICVVWLLLIMSCGINFFVLPRSALSFFPRRTLLSLRLGIFFSPSSISFSGIVYSSLSLKDVGFKHFIYSIFWGHWRSRRLVVRNVEDVCIIT